MTHRLLLRCIPLSGGVFLEFSSNIVVKKTTACVGSGFCLSFFSAKKAELMNYGFAVLSCWEDASALPKMVVTQLNAPSTLATESLLELICIVQFTVPGEDVLHAVERGTLSNTTENAGVATVDNLSINEGLAQYSTTTRLLQDYFEEDCARVCVAKERVLLNFWLE